MSEIGIGSKVWLRREYSTRVEESEIAGESGRSWLIAKTYFDPFKVQKKPNAAGEYWTAKLFRDRRARVFFSLEDVEATQRAEAEAERVRRWISLNRDSISYATRICVSESVLRQIAALVNYEPKEQA